MTYGSPDISGRRRRIPGWGIAAAALLSVPLLWLIAVTVDQETIASVWDAVEERPIGLFLSTAAFGVAFLLRSVAWTRVLPDLSPGQSWAGLHLALGGNHVLPLRLGEPLRIASVVRRAGIDWQRATASTVTLRSADLLAIGLIGVVAGMGAFSAWWASSVVVLGGLGFAGIGLAWLHRLRDKGDVVLPGPVAMTATTLAWGFEAVVVFQAASWAGIDLTFGGAMLVTSAAVVAQVAAIAPGGLGTYEAGGVAAMVFLGVDPSVGLAVVLSAHAVKTGYSLLFGVIAALVPAPGMLGRLRIAKPDEPVSGPGAVQSAKRPVVLFLPAFNESASVSSVVGRVPETVAGYPVVCLVVDDGSTDDTTSVAASAGAQVIRLEGNRGLGAAVRVGLAAALQHDPVAVAFCDADGEYSPEELGVMVAPVLEGRADYVVGSRFDGDIERMLPHRRVGNLVLTWLLSWVARHRIGDGQSGYRAFSPRAAAAAEVIHDFNYAQVITLDLLAKGMRYVEVPISYSFRTRGQSFVKPGRYLRAVVPAVYREVNA